VERDTEKELLAFIKKIEKQRKKLLKK